MSSCVTVKQIMGKTFEKDKVVYMAFVELEKVNREKLWRVLEEHDIEGRLLLAIQSLYEGGNASVRIEDRVRLVWGE